MMIIWRNMVVGFFFLLSIFVSFRYIFEYRLVALVGVILAGFFAWVMYRIYTTRVRRDIGKAFEKRGVTPTYFYDYFNIFGAQEARLLGLWIDGTSRIISYDDVSDVVAWSLDGGRRYELGILFKDGARWRSFTISRRRADEFVSVVRGILAGDAEEVGQHPDVEVQANVA